MEKYLIQLTREEYDEHKSEGFQALRQERAHDQAVKNAGAECFIQAGLERKHTQAAERKRCQRAREQEIGIETGHRNVDGSLRKKECDVSWIALTIYHHSLEFFNLEKGSS